MGGANKFTVLVGNRSDLIDRRKISIEEAQEFAEKNNYHYIEVSCKTNTNVEEIFKMIGENILQNQDKKKEENEEKNTELTKEEKNPPKSFFSIFWKKDSIFIFEI